MKKRLFTLMMLLMTLSFAIEANPVNMNLAREVGAKFVNVSTTMRTTANDLRHVTTYSTDNQVEAFYVFNVANGFIIVAADDCSIPILAYSEEGQFDVNNIPMQMEGYLQVYRREIQYGIEHGLSADESIAKQWNMLRTTGSLYGTRTTTAVEPLLSETWNQNCYYNALCPEDADGPCGHVYAGCVATAMGQIMHFWQYPIVGSGSHSYYPDGYPQQTANFGATTYAWNDMPDDLNASSTSTQINAVATLLWHCGVAVEMMYGAGASGAYSNNVPYALTEYFNYSDELYGQDKYDNSSWLALIKSNLDLGLPVYYSGSDVNGYGGHAFVCDGYDSNDYLHFNWGWSGSGNNAYFALDALNVNGYEFNDYNYAIFNIRPQSGETYQITTIANPDEGGTVTGGGTYYEGQLCTLTAVSDYDYSFVNWTKDGIEVSTDPTISFMVTEDATYTANFELFIGLTVGDGSTNTNVYLPSYSYYCHSLTQQIYTPDEIEWAGSILSLAFYNDGGTKTQNYDIYMINTDKVSFTGSYDWIPVTEEDLVFSGDVTMISGGWTTIPFDNPFVYEGNSNLAIVVDNNTGSYTGSPYMACRVFETDEVQAIRVYSDGTNYDPFNPFGYSGTLYTQKNQIRLAFDMVSSEPVVIPDTLAMGYRPNNAWMRPYKIQIYNSGNYSLINSISTDNPYFQLEEVEFPFALGYHKSREISLTTGIGTGEMSGHLIINYGDNQTTQFDLSAIAYDPAIKDVWETAYEISSYPFTDSLVVSDIPLYDNYNLPPVETQDGADAIYKLVFEQDALLNASMTSGEDGKLILYKNGFSGEGGPKVNNSYTGPLEEEYSEPFETQVGEETSTFRFFPFYTYYDNSIAENLFLADELTAVGMKKSNLHSLSWYATNSPGYLQQNISIWLANVTETELNTGVSHIPSDMTLVYTGSCTPQIGWNEFEFNESDFVWDGVSNLLICVQRNNGSYNSSVYWQCHDAGFYATTYSYRDGSYYDMLTTTYSMYYTTTRPNIIFKGSGNEAGSLITDRTVSAGTYYLVTSSTSDAWGIEINTTSLSCPDLASHPTPADYDTDVIPTAVLLQWSLGERATEYKLLLGTDYDNLETIVDWTRDLTESYVVTGLLNNANYFWQVMERNDGCPEGVEGSIWGFTTLLNGPQDLYAWNNTLFEGDDLTLEWTPLADTNILSYNVYQDNEWIGNTMTNNYVVSGLTYNMEGYNFYVTAVYAGGESNASNSAVVYVSGNGTVAGHVYEVDGITGIENATVTFSGNDEFGNYRTFAFTTDADGYYTGSIKAGSYSATATCNGYQSKYYNGSVGISYNLLTNGVDIVMDEVFYPVSMVVASYYPDAQDSNSPYVKVNWDTYTDLVFDFDDNSMQGWTNIDADGDGNVWVSSSNPGIYHNSGISLSGTGHNGSEAYVISGSYANQTGAVLYPDNYLVSPQMVLGGSITFYACAQDASYAAEHFGVAVSTSGNINASDFTTIQEWTMTAKDSGVPTTFTRSGNRDQGAWYQYTVDLSSYAGQIGYVAIRHFDCYDQFILNIDDITISEPDRAVPSRSFSHYKVYRTNAYNNGPFTEENTVLLADNVTDNLLIDITWQDVEAGVYKFGVSRVFEGNRESQIMWTELNEGNHDANTQLMIQSEYNDFNGPAPLVVVPDNTSLPILRTESSEAIVARWHHGNDFAGFFLNDPTQAYSFGFTNDVFTNGACYMNGTLYFSDSNGKFGTINPENGLTVIATDRPFTVIDDNPVDGKMYGCNPSGYLYEINPNDGSYVQLAYMPVSVLVTFTITNDGRFIICDRGEESIKEYDPVVGTLTTLISFDWDIEYGQDMATDRETNEVYWAAYNNSNYTMPLIKIDVNSNTAITIGYFDSQVSAFAITNNHTITTNRESEIVWSNAMDKNMYFSENDVNITVALNSGDSPEGVVVSFINLNAGEQSLYPVEDVTLDATGYYVWNNFRRGDYQVQVSFNGYNTITEEVSIWEATDLNYVLEEINYGLSNLYVSRTGWAMWTDSEHGNTIPVIGEDTGDTFFVDFEEGFPSDWTTIDANNDGYTWLTIDRIGEWGSSYQGVTFNWAHNSSNSALSSSYLNGIGILYPDDFLVSPKVIIENGSHISFWAAATDMNYAADHFGIAVSTGSNTNANDFVVIQEWTMTAKGGSRDGNVRDRNNGNRDINNWYYYDVDLSAYAGLEVYLAFRHFNCSDQYILTVDDVELYNSFEAKNNRHFNNYQMELSDTEENVIYQGTISDCFMQLPVENLVDGETYHLKVAAVYSSGIGEWQEIDWAYQSCDNFEVVTELNMDMNDTANIISWTYPTIEERSIMTGSYPAYACRLYNGDNYDNPEGWCSINLDSPEISNLISTNPYVYGGDYCPLDGYVHATDYNYNWFVIEPETGEILDQGYLGVYFRDCAWDYTTNMMYGVSGSYLYSWDVENNITAQIGSMAYTMQILACDLDGQLYAISSSNGDLYRIDKETGASTYVGYTGQYTYYVQSGGFDHYSGKLYWAGYGNNGFFAEVDTETGQATVLANNTGEVLSFCVPFNGSDYISPVTGVLGAMVYRDGELLGFTTQTSYTDSIAIGNHEYEVRVVYDGRNRCPNFNSYYAMSCPLSIGGESYEVMVTANPAQGGLTTGAGTYINGFPCTVTATANENYVFTNWVMNGEEVANTPEYTFRVTDNTIMEANFIGFTPHWEVVNNPEYSPQSLIGVVNVNGEELTGNYMEVAALCGNECRGQQMLTYYPDRNRFFVFMTIYGQDGDDITFSLYNHELGEETEYSCLSHLTFDSEATVGSYNDPYVILFGIIQTTTMQTGWNWYSTIVEQEGNEGLDMLEASLGSNGVMIKSQTDGFDINYNNLWMGNLDFITNDQMYMINTNAPIETVVSGFSTNVNNHPITLYTGWTWVGYPHTEALDINDALANLNATNGDILKSKQTFSTYIEGQGWYGTLNTLEPSTGMMYHSKKNSNTTFTYSDAPGRMELIPNLTAENNHWIPNDFEYPDNMSVMAVVELNYVELADGDYELAALENGKCLGSAKLIYVGPTNRYMAFLTLSGEENHVLSFSLYDAETGVAYTSTTETVVFTPNAIVGSMDEPLVVHFDEATGINQYDVTMTIHPNPADRGSLFSIAMSTNKTETVMVEIINALGEVVSVTSSSQSPMMVKAPDIAGIYMVRMIINGKESYSRKLIVK